MICCVRNKREQLGRKNISFSMLELELTLSWTLVIGVQYDMKVKHNLLRQLDKHRAVSRNFSSMQEITLYFLGQSRLRFMLI